MTRSTRPLRSAPGAPRVRGPLDGVNDAFHVRYGVAQSKAASGGPVLVVLADRIVLCRGRRRRVVRRTTLDFHIVKSAAHAPIALYSTLCAPGGRIGTTERRALVELRGFAVASLESLDVTDVGVATDIRDVLVHTVDLANRVVKAGKVSARKLAAFGRANGDVLRRLTMHASRLQLTSLDAAVDEALRGLARRERRTLHVVVSGDHQARIRSLDMQYFQKRFGERPGDEKRVAYGEGVTTVGEALALVGTRRHDAVVASAFFGDAKRLQRDVLGDAAAAILAKTPLTKLGR